VFRQPRRGALQLRVRRRRFAGPADERSRDVGQGGRVARLPGASITGSALRLAAIVRVE
jgi:hypothetical protein